jgi:hypothetical protein
MLLRMPQLARVLRLLWLEAELVGKKERGLVLDAKRIPLESLPFYVRISGHFVKKLNGPAPL